MNCGCVCVCVFVCACVRRFFLVCSFSSFFPSSHLSFRWALCCFFPLLHFLCKFKPLLHGRTRFPQLPLPICKRKGNQRKSRRAVTKRYAIFWLCTALGLVFDFGRWVSITMPMNDSTLFSAFRYYQLIVIRSKKKPAESNLKKEKLVIFSKAPQFLLHRAFFVCRNFCCILKTSSIKQNAHFHHNMKRPYFKCGCCLLAQAFIWMGAVSLIASTEPLWKNSRVNCFEYYVAYRLLIRMHRECCFKVCKWDISLFFVAPHIQLKAHSRKADN